MNFSGKLKEIEKSTFRIHLISQFFNGISLGVIGLQEIILKRTLQGTNIEITVLSILVSSSFLVSMYGAEIIGRSADKFRSIIIAGVIGKTFLVLAPFAGSSELFIICIGINACSDSFILPIWNIVFKHNYSDTNRSRLYSYAALTQTTLIIICTTLFGFLMDLNVVFYKIAFTLAGITGLIVYYCLGRMLITGSEEKFKIEKLQLRISFKLIKDIVLLPFRNIRRIFSSNSGFLKFEINFFIYGIAFIMLATVMPVFLVEKLSLSYSPISLAKGLIFHSAYIIFTPLMGKFHGMGNPTKFCGYAFLLLSLYPAIMIFSVFLPTMKYEIFYASYFFFGLAMSGVNIAWTLSSIHFAPANEVANYQAVHITLTGVRGIFSPLLGYLIMTTIDIEYVFYLSALLFITAGILMLSLNKNSNT
ncbi:MAG: MFS transporter [Ignavibacteria bacterium]|nr:MFS transporter [Ignavibacteria bacterium]